MDDSKSSKRKRTAASTSSDISPRPSSRSKTVVVLDVGGTLFRVAKSTLTSNSTYMESLFSERWSSNDDDDNNNDNDNDQPIFIDQEPNAFSILLKYMRTGLVHLPKNDKDLCEVTLVQAEFLGIDGFLTTVKATANRFISKQMDNTSACNEVAEATEFDEKFGSSSMKEIIGNGILPLCYFPPVEELEIRVEDKTRCFPKSSLIEHSAYFKELLTKEPSDYWMESHLMFGSADLVLFTVQLLCEKPTVIATLKCTMRKVVENVVGKYHTGNAGLEVFGNDLAKLLTMLGISTERIQKILETVS